METSKTSVSNPHKLGAETHKDPESTFHAADQLIIDSLLQEGHTRRKSWYVKKLI